MGPAHSTPSITDVDTAGLEGKTKTELKRMFVDMNDDPSEQEDHAHMVESPSFVEYAYITETSTQSNPDPASITLPNTFKEAKASSHSSQWTTAVSYTHLTLPTKA